MGQVEHLETRALMTIAAATPLPDVTVAAGAAAVPVDLGSHFNDPTATDNFAIFDTSLGTIPVLMTPSTTPKTVANFESYINKGAYSNSIVHRSVPGFVWQAGGFQLTTKPDVATTATDAPVQNEFGASNVRGTIAMAKLGSDPNSATSQFFFNESDANAANLDKQNGGFTVFGRVVGQSGLAVMDAIAAAPVPSPGPMASPLDSAPLLNYKAGTTVQPSNLVLIKSVTTADEGFSAVSDAPAVASASLQGNKLVVTPLAAGTAKITVVGYGSDGSAATETFRVTVSPGTQPSTTPIAVKPQAVAPVPGLSVTARGALPATAIAGQKARIQQTVGLTASSGAVSQRLQAELVLSSTTSGASSDSTIASKAANVRFKAGVPARMNLSAGRLDSALTAGTYRVLVSVTDPNGAKTTIDTGKTLTVQPPQAKPIRR
ncbi:peptidylprolyl isomerase [Paludisphaera mucosa]|uniref:peptidylprolyl isomerase n=1 Tax=Paludisphaera mucosa TaxID=3030827 RepID=A0ABT6F484_9BACT|nr:peptidylprolyl isomerase [Paludisphaera mucosa]MDG3002248.1 peptidylprolyl isomerase [Paludisphaera mucosa]